MRIRELGLGLWPIEWMRFRQFPLQILLVHLLRITVFVHVEVKRFLQWEVFLVCHVRGREIVFVDRFSDACK